MTGTSIQEAGQFAGDAPLTGHHIQGHSINVILAKGVPEEVLRSSVTHFGTRGLFGKPIRRTSKHDRDNVRRKRWRVAQTSKPKVKPKLNHQLEEVGGRDYEGAAGNNRRVLPSVANATGSVNTADKRIPPLLAPPVPPLPCNNVKSSSLLPYSRHDHLPAGGALPHPVCSRPKAFLGLASDGARSPSANHYGHALPLPVALAGQVQRTLGSHTPHTPALAKRHINTPSVVLETPHASRNTMAHTHGPLSHHPPSQTVNPSGLRKYHSTTMGTTIWPAAHQGRHLGHPYVPATAMSGASEDHQQRGPAGKGAERATHAQRACGPIRATRATFYQHAASPYPSPSHRYAEGHAHLSRSPATAESSVVAGCARYRVVHPVTTTGTHQGQVQQHDGTSIHSDTHHLSTRISPSHSHTILTSSTPHTYMSTVPVVNSINQHQYGARTSTSASVRTYSELAHALLDHHSVAPPAMQAAISAGGVPTPLFAPHITSGLNASTATSAPESPAWHAHWQHCLPIAPQPILNHPPAGLVADAAITPDISRVHATDDDDAMIRIPRRRLPSHDIAAFLHGMDCANRRPAHEMHVEATTSASRNEHRQKLLTTSTWEEVPQDYDTHISTPRGPTLRQSVRAHIDIKPT